jgi:hypothetical protein
VKGMKLKLFIGKKMNCCVYSARNPFDVCAWSHMLAHRFDISRYNLGLARIGYSLETVGSYTNNS